MLKLGQLFLIILFLFGCESESKLEIIFGGDVMLDRGIRAQINLKGMDFITENIRPVFQHADYTIVNLECPVTEYNTPLTKKFVFRAEPEWLESLHDAGITHCILANNHSYDQGREGLTVTAKNLENANLIPLGFGKTQSQACKPILISKNDIEVAIFSSVTLPLESWMYLETAPGMCQASIEDLQQEIISYRKAHQNRFIIVTLHWGAEYQHIPMPLQRKQARELIKAGADAIIGHHPHVIQSFESINGKPIFYSLGNLIFDNPNKDTQEGILVKISLSHNLNTVEIIPYHSEGGKPVIMNEPEKTNLTNRLQKISDPLP